MTAIAQYLPDFSDENVSSDAPVDRFIPFETGGSDHRIWQDLFDYEDGKETEETTFLASVVPLPESLNESLQPEVNAPASQVDIQQPEVSTISIEEHEAIINDLEKHYEDQIDELKQSCGDWFSRDLDELKSLAVEQLSRELETAVVHALVPFGRKRLAQEAAQQLVAEINATLSQNSMLKARLAGPAVLIDSVLGLLGEDAEHFTTEIAQRSELTLEADGKVTRTVIGNWADQLDGFLNA